MTLRLIVSIRLPDLDRPSTRPVSLKRPLRRDMVLAATPKCAATALALIPPCNIPYAIERCSDVSLGRRPKIEIGSVFGEFD